MKFSSALVRFLFVISTVHHVHAQEYAPADTQAEQAPVEAQASASEPDYAAYESQTAQDPPVIPVPAATTTATATATPPVETQQSTTAQADIIGATKETCPIPAPKIKEINPTMIASYPGSGAKLTWKLIRAISGYMTSDDAVDLNDLSKNGQAIAIKTHFPAHGSNDDLFSPFMDVPRSVLLIRNPFNAIPSFHSYLYEQSLQLTGHSVRAPENIWVTWRDTHFDNELNLWKEHTIFWMNHHDYENRHILPYEFLIKAGPGPTELRKLRNFLEKSIEPSGLVMRTHAEKVACIWDYVVMRRADQGTNKGSMRAGGPKVWPYTQLQAQKMKDVMNDLKLQFPGQLGTLMELYIYQINDALTTADMY
jgi:hypothetical protein